jgi:uncharacterized membrane protein
MMSLRRIRPIGRVRRTEQGQTLPLVTLSLVALMIGAALSVDIGALAVTNRRLQAVADMAAIDGSRELTGTTCADTYVVPTDSPQVPSTQYDHVVKAVVASAKRNGFEAAGPKTLLVELGMVTRDGAGVPTFSPLPNLCNVVPDSVRVRTGDLTGFSFATVIGQSGRSTVRRAVGTLDGLAAFTLGSTMVSIDSTRATLLNPILSSTICRLQPGGCNLNLSAAGYNGLLGSYVTFGDLATQLGFGSTEELFDADVSIEDLLTASALLADPSTTAGADARTALASITAVMTAAGTVKLGEMVSADMANGNQAAGLGINLYQLVMGTAAIANGTNAVAIPNTSVTIPYVSNVTASISLIEAPVIIGYRAGATRTTKQISITINPTINLTSPVLSGLNLTSITGSLPITISGGTATGTLTRVRCGSNKGIDTSIQVNAASMTAGGTLNVSLNTSSNTSLLQSLVGLLGTVPGGRLITTTLTVSGSGVSTATGSTNVSFAYPDEFGPAGAMTVGNTTLGLDNLTYGNANLSMNVPLVNLLGISLGTTTVNLAVSPAAIVALLAPVMDAIDDQLVQPLMESLGLIVGAADVMANPPMVCGVPTLAG